MPRAAEPSWREQAVVCGGIVALALAIYAQVHSFGFVDFDDNVYLLANDRVGAGLTGENVAWAFTTGYHANWHPVTWLSYLLEIEVFGLEPGPMHITNALLHTINALLLYLVLLRYTRASIAAAFIAALFVVHPLHVESVAWISERKDLLCAFFWLLAMLAYQRYAQAPSLWRYVPVAVSAMLALGSKPMAVTLPIALLLLDYWPLRRSEPFGRLVLEKLPLFALAASVALVTWVVQQSSESVQSLATIPLDERLGNAIAAYVWYVQKTIWPSELAVFYPHPRASLSVVTVLMSLLLVVAITIVAVQLRARHPYLLMGWLWFLAVLLPVIGVVQVGGQAYADRYAYLAHVGIFMAMVFPIASHLRQRARYQNAAAFGAAVLILAMLSLASIGQTAHWRDTETLFTRATAVTEDNVLAHDILGRYYARQARYAAAEREFMRALAINADYAAGHVELGHALKAQDRLSEAESHFVYAAEREPHHPEAWYELGKLRSYRGEHESAWEAFEKALGAVPDSAIVLTAYGNALARAALEGPEPILTLGERALCQFDAAIALDADYALARQSRAALLDAMAPVRAGELED